MSATRPTSPRWLFVLALVLLLAPPASAGPVAPDRSDHQVVDRTARRVTAELEKRGFEVGDGYFQLWGIEHCRQSYDVMGSCYFNNPAAPYLLPALPYWPEEFVDPATAGAFGATKKGYGTTFRLDPNEAIVIFGFLPPEASYFGVQSYLFSRKGAWETDNETYEFLTLLGAKDIFFHKIPQNKDRIASLDSLSDSNNNVVIERQSGGSWGEFRYFVITPDRYMDKQVRQALHRLGVEKADIFSEAIPANMTLGLDQDADDFLTLLRYSRPADGGGPGTASDNWRHDPALAVLRVRDTRPHRPAQRYPAWEANSPEPRTATPEAYLQPDRDALVYAVSQAWDQPCDDEDCTKRSAAFIDTQSHPFNLVGPKCDDIGMDCLADTQDASYQFRPGHYFDDGQVWAVIGTLGTATGNATYVSLGLNQTYRRLGAKNVDGSALEGSASDFYGEVSNADKLYVYYFTRDCEGLEELTHGFCMSVEVDDLVIPAGMAGTLVERDYMAAGTQRGPDSTLTLPSRVLLLHRPAPKE